MDYTQDDEIAELKAKMDDMAEEFGEMLRVRTALYCSVLYCSVLYCTYIYRLFCLTFFQVYLCAILLHFYSI